METFDIPHEMFFFGTAGVVDNWSGYWVFAGWGPRLHAPTAGPPLA